MTFIAVNGVERALEHRRCESGRGQEPVSTMIGAVPLLHITIVEGFRALRDFSAGR